MIIVITNGYNVDYIKEICDSMNIMGVHINREILREQSRIIEKAIDTCRNKQGKIVGRKIRNEIEKIDKHIDSNGKIEYMWRYQNDSMSTYPASFVDGKQFGVRLADAIELDSETKLVEVELPDILNLIAFEYGRIQLGYDNETLEDKMSNLGIAGFHDINEVRDCITGFDYVFDQIRRARIEASEYYTDDGIMQGYFSKTRYNLFKDARYESIISLTCRTISEIIAAEATEKLTKVDSETSLISIGRNRILLIVSKDTNIKEYIDRYAIKIVGRQVKINSIIKETF